MISLFSSFWLKYFVTALAPKIPALSGEKKTTTRFNSGKLAPVVYPPAKSVSKGHEVLETPPALSV